MIRRPPRSTLDRSSAASDVYKRQEHGELGFDRLDHSRVAVADVHAHQLAVEVDEAFAVGGVEILSLIHISEPTRPY